MCNNMFTKPKHLYHFISRIEKIEQSLIPQDPIQNFLYYNFKFNKDGHYGGEYHELRMRRIEKVLEVLGTEHKGKRILDLGGGLGDTGAFFAELGAEVTLADGRLTNLNIAQLRFPKLICKHINAELPFGHLGKFDVIMCFAFLEVIKDIGNVVKCMKEMTDTIILETTVTDSDEIKNYEYAMPARNDSSIIGIGSKPSPAYIEMLFRDWNIDRYKENLDTDNDCYSWKPRNDGSSKRDNKHLRRFWVFTK